MAEITHKGVWIKWSSLGARDKGWFTLSTLTAIPFGMVIGVPAGEWIYRIGYHLGSGGGAPNTLRMAELSGSAAYRYAVLAAFLCAAVSAAAWWRFSLNQDELFNRIQNYALGRAGAWSLAGVAAWWLLSLGGWTGPFLPGPFLLAASLLLAVLWFRAVARWA